MGITSFARRFRWHVHALGFNPLIRLSDRLEVFAVLAVLVTALCAMPVAAGAGAEIYDAGVRSAHQQSHDRHAVAAVALDGSATMPADFNSSARVRAQWQEGTVVRTEDVVTPVTVKAGDTLQIWLDRNGKVVPAPLTEDDAELGALGVTGTVWLALVACSVMVAVAIRVGLDRSRDRAWERELRLLAHNDDGWANRHT